MDYSTLIIGIIFIVLIAGPVGLLIRSGKKRTEKMEKVLKELSQKFELNFDLHEVWNDKLLALDSRSMWLAYAIRKENTQYEQLIDLSKIRKCSTNKHELPKKGEDQAILRVELQFLHKYEQGHLENILLYDADEDEAVEGVYHSEIARRWQLKISESLKRARS